MLHSRSVHHLVILRFRKLASNQKNGRFCGRFFCVLVLLSRAALRFLQGLIGSRIYRICIALRHSKWQFYMSSVVKKGRLVPDAGKIARRSRLAFRHAGLLCRALVTVAVSRILLCVLPYRKISKLIQLRPTRAAIPRNPYLVAWAVKNAARIVPVANCLTQALAAQYILARSGVVATVRIGVAQDADAKVEAHAWVLHEDIVILGGAKETLGRFAFLTDLTPLEP